MWVSNREDWEAIKDRGKRRYILTNGILGRGLPMGVIVALAVEIALGNPLPESLGSPSFLGRAVLASVIFSLGGCATAYANWSSLERRFARPDLGDR